jgi:hypothetical protein
MWHALTSKNNRGLRGLNRLNPRIFSYRVVLSGSSRNSPANKTNSPFSPAFVILTRVAAHASARVSGSSSGASIDIGFAPRPLA